MTKESPITEPEEAPVAVVIDDGCDNAEPAPVSALMDCLTQDEGDDSCLASNNNNDDDKIHDQALEDKASIAESALQLTFLKALWVLRFAIFIDAVNSQILGPNYALMVLDEGHTDSFESTDPFGFGGAYYFIPMSSDIGVVLSSIIFGYLSDQPWCGRKRSILACMYLGALGSMAKYLCRDNFWAFCAANFGTGLVGGSVAVALAYVTDLSTNRKEADAEIGKIIGISMVGRTGGGVMAIAMQSLGLFEPLLAGAALCVLAGILCHVWMVEPEKPSIESAFLASNGIGKDKDGTESTRDESDNTYGDDSGEVDLYPTVLDKKTLCHIMLGELADSLGSIGLVPICLSPLLFRTFYADFIEQSLDPIMSATSYKWIYVFVAVIVIPGAAVAPALFQKFGPALCCVLANLFTGAVTVALLQIANIDPPTFATYCVFVTVLYLAFPFTVISQLSTGPMMDRITPFHQRGQIQGLNMATMNLANAIGPFSYAILYDNSNIDITLYTAVGVSVMAAVINSCLIKDLRFGPDRTKEKDLADPNGGDKKASPATRCSMATQATQIELLSTDCSA